MRRDGSELGSGQTGTRVSGVSEAGHGCLASGTQTKLSHERFWGSKDAQGWLPREAASVV